VPRTTFVWKTELGSAPDSAFSAQLGNVTYHVATRDYGHPAYIEVHGPRGGRNSTSVTTSKSSRLSRLVSGTTRLVVI
jgi:hypothetical protein